MRNFRKTMPSNSESKQRAAAPSLDLNEDSKATTSAADGAVDENIEEEKWLSRRASNSKASRRTACVSDPHPQRVSPNGTLPEVQVPTFSHETNEDPMIRQARQNAARAAQKIIAASLVGSLPSRRGAHSWPWLQRQWQAHLQEWHGHVEIASSVVSILSWMGVTQVAVSLLKYLLPPAPGHYRSSNDDPYHRSLVVSLLAVATAPPLLELEGESMQPANAGPSAAPCFRRLPLPLRALNIARQCHRASIRSKDQLRSALMQVLPVAAR